MSRVGSSRWSPTPEQLMILEELYRSGTRTPTASQIQQITTHLCFYGRIEGKNVFYWFQNHKARDRQKLRRKLNRQLQLQQQQQQQMQVHRYHLNIQDKSHHCSFCGFGSSCGSSSTQQICFYNPAILLSRGEAADTSEKTETSFCNYGWTTRPLKTLDLFPTTATKLKEDCTTSSKQLYQSMSTSL